MNTLRRTIVLLMILSVAHQAAVFAGTPVGTTITYQGQLKETGVPLNGNVDLQFELFDAEVDGNPIVSPLLLEDVPVVKGLFSVELDFGAAAFTGDARWAQIEVQVPQEGGGDTTEFCATPGAGGGIRLLAPIISGQGTVSTDKGFGFGGIKAGFGRVRMEAFQNDFTGSIVGVSRLATLSPHAIILPDTPLATIVVTQIAGFDVPDAPSGSFLDPDVTMDSSTAVELVIEATNVPTDAGLTLSLYPETGPDRIIAAAFVSGDESASTWTASATFPNGFSRTFVSVTWVP